MKEYNKHFELSLQTFRGITLAQMEETQKLIPSLGTNQEFIGE
jgi:hypothetical protein